MEDKSFFNDGETLEQWVERIANESVWREFIAHIDEVKLRSLKELEPYKEELAKKLSEVFVNDVASLFWDSPPLDFTLDFSPSIQRRTISVILSAREEVTREVPEKEKLWKALRRMYDMAYKERERGDWLRQKVLELENELELVESEARS